MAVGSIHKNNLNFGDCETFAHDCRLYKTRDVMIIACHFWSTVNNTSGIQNCRISVDIQPYILQFKEQIFLGIFYS
jgi:hypothetical protein